MDIKAEKLSADEQERLLLEIQGSHDVGTSKGFYDCTGKIICLKAREKAAVHYSQLCGWVPPVSEILYLVISVGIFEVCSAISAALQ